MSRTLILGGTRSGKTALAERLAGESGRHVVYVATATAGDGEMVARIERHRARRPPEWGLEEEPCDLAGVLDRHAGLAPCLLIDCMSLWLANLLDAEQRQAGGAATDNRIEAFLRGLESWPGTLIVVSNEVGLGGIAMDPLTRRFADRLGWLNQDLAGRCDRVLLTVAGLPLTLKEPARP